MKMKTKTKTKTDTETRLKEALEHLDCGAEDGVCPEHLAFGGCAKHLIQRLEAEIRRRDQSEENHICCCCGDCD
jgi:hypothetical protein